MYELRQKKIKEMQQKRWYGYALLAVAMFLFSQGSAIIKTNVEIALPAILISFILHARSVGNLAERIFKIKKSIVANIAMLVVLSVISIISYLNPLKLIYIILLNIAAVTIYIITAAVSDKFKTGV